MGEVYRARDTKLDRDVVLKVLPALFANDPERLGRFQREAKVLASLNHPNIGSIYGLEESDGVQALVLELIEGPTLADRIAQGQIPIDEALPIARQISGCGGERPRQPDSEPELAHRAVSRMPAEGLAHAAPATQRPRHGCQRLTPARAAPPPAARTGRPTPRWPLRPPRRSAHGVRLNDGLSGDSGHLAVAAPHLPADTSGRGLATRFKGRYQDRGTLEMNRGFPTSGLPTNESGIYWVNAAFDGSVLVVRALVQDDDAASRAQDTIPMDEIRQLVGDIGFDTRLEIQVATVPPQDN